MYQKVHRWTESDTAVLPEPKEREEAAREAYNENVEELPERRRMPAPDDGGE